MPNTDESPPYSTWSYGEHRDQFVRVWRLNARSETRTEPETHPVAFIVHGGFWKKKWTIDNAGHTSLAPDLAKRGICAVEVEYRRCEDGRPCWPAANEDVMAAIRKVMALQVEEIGFLIDWSKVVLVGHSAGGTLVLWAAAHISSCVSLHLKVGLKLVVALAPVTDLALGARMKLSDEGDAIQNYIGGSPEKMQQAYEQASPNSYLESLANTRILLVCGTKDIDVPLVFCESFCAELAEREPRSSLVSFIRAVDQDHCDIAKATSSSWKSVMEHLNEACTS